MAKTQQQVDAESKQIEEQAKKDAAAASQQPPTQPAPPQAAKQSEFRHPFKDIPSGKYTYHVGNPAKGFDATVMPGGKEVCFKDQKDPFPLDRVPKQGVFVAK